ncbi:type II toxin-antitoxin system PemK/MazF family toxin [Candidatus Gracilibacteria bacterium]|nr:type II toxin-antitoxin system PemK/MazF family toxin [Candidatus Gracilibacteria bacterium]
MPKTVSPRVVMPKKYKRWAKMKSIIEKFHGNLVCSPRDIVWVYIGTNIGHEECGHGNGWKRPVLILKRYGPLYLVIPTTSKGLTLENGVWVVKRNHKKITSANMPKNSFLIMNQIRTIDGKRIISKVKDNIGADVMMDIPEFLYIRSELCRMIKS